MDLHPEELESIVQAHRADGCVLYLMHMALLLCRPPTKTCVGQTLVDVAPAANLTDDLLLPDFVYDKHTKRGRDLYRRGLRHFVEHGCRLSHCDIADPYYDLLLREVGLEE